MNYKMLRKLRDELISKPTKTTEENELLKELTSLNRILDPINYSLSISSNNCPTCGNPLK